MTDNLSSAYPTVADVGAILRARTKDANGAELGTFTADTRPTDTQAQAVIAQAANELSASVGFVISEQAIPIARHVIALKTAMLVELSFWPEQVARGISPYEHYRDLFKTDLASLIEMISSEGGAGGTIPGGNDGMPSYGFPEDVGGLIGWGTRW